MGELFQTFSHVDVALERTHVLDFPLEAFQTFELYLALDSYWWWYWTRKTLVLDERKIGTGWDEYWMTWSVGIIWLCMYQLTIEPSSTGWFGVWVSDDLQCGYRMIWSVSTGWPPVWVLDDFQCRNILFWNRNIGLNHHHQKYCIIILLITNNMENYVLTT